MIETTHSVSSREQEEAVDLMLDERLYQDGKWGQALDDTHTPEDWTRWITEYLTGEDRAANYNWAKRLVKVGALAMAALESELRKGNR